MLDPGGAVDLLPRYWLLLRVPRAGGATTGGVTRPHSDSPSPQQDRTEPRTTQRETGTGPGTDDRTDHAEPPGPCCFS